MISPLPAASPAGPLDRLAPTRRPAGRALGYHCWTNLLFVHWRVPAETIRPLIPPELTLDTWDGDAWVGLVPFYMSRIRPWWSPAVPGVSYFCETNVRTYVHYQGRDPGVWFFSLDASNSLAVRVARWRWHLPYFRSRMRLDRRDSNLQYACERLWPGNPGAGCRIEVETGDLIGRQERARSRPAGQALPGTLEHFLIERYILYAQPRAGRLVSGFVHHSPYPIREARLLGLEASLLEAASIPRPGAPCHVAFSDGVSVEIFPLRPVD